MSLDVLVLGPFVFDDWSAPERLPGGGRHNLITHKLPGGGRVIDAMGPDDIDRGWTGTLWGDSALSDALTLDALRRSGEPLPFSNGYEARTVVILEFLPLVRKFQCVEYSILLTPTDSFGGGGGGFGFGIGGGFASGLGLGGFATLDGLVSADVGVSVDLVNGVSVTASANATVTGVGGVGAALAL